jgi:hypothetical protein
MKNLKTKRSLFIKNYLTVNYSKKSKDELINELKLSWSYIQKLAHLFGIKREFNESNKSFNLKKLLDGSNESLYWIGFIIADGHISKANTIQINLHKKDYEHLNSLINYLDSKVSIRIKENIIRCVLTDVPSVLSLKKMFNWSSNKTKNPVEIPNLTDDQLFSLIIGFIDGDGYINSKRLVVKCDKSWENILMRFYTHLTGEKKKFNYVDNCSIFYILKKNILRSIKNKSISLNLPIMKRKWNKIDTNKVLKYEKSKIVLKLIMDGKSIRDIKDQGFSSSLIYSVRKNMNLKLI